MEKTGYKKVFFEDRTFNEAGEIITGKVYSVTFYLPGGLVDPEQKYFVKDGEDVDVVLSRAYYEKRLSIIDDNVEVKRPVAVIQSPKPFAEFSDADTFKDVTEENLDLLDSNKEKTKGVINPLTGLAGK